MEDGKEDELPIEEETRRLVDLLRVLARTLGFNNAALARQADVPLATLVRYFKGEGGPKLEFVLAVVRALGLEVREFFDLAYPEPAAPSPARLKIERMLGHLHLGKLRVLPAPPPPEEKEELVVFPRPEIERLLEDLRRDVRELLEARAREDRSTASPPRPEDRPGPPRTRKAKGRS